MYYVNTDTLCIEEIQIKPKYRVKGIIEILYAYLVKQIPANILYVEAFAHKKYTSPIEAIKKADFWEEFSFLKSLLFCLFTHSCFLPIPKFRKQSTYSLLFDKSPRTKSRK